jgi:hypothetical protein
MIEIFKNRRLLVVLTTLVCSLVVMAKGRPEYYHKHFAGFHYSGAYTTMLHGLHEHGLSQGGYGALGFVYEYNRYNLLMQTGVNFSFMIKSVGLKNDSIIRYKVIDTQKDEYRLRYVFENRVDNSIAKYVEIPLLVGQKYANFYFLGGVKLNILLESQSYIETEVTTTAMYDRYIDEFHDMFNHALFRDKPINVLNDGIDFNLGVTASFETGYSFSSFDYRTTGYGRNRGEEHVFRIAFFAEYGLPIINQLKGENLDLYTIYDKNPVSVDAIKMNHVYYTFAKNNFLLF